MGHPLNVYGYHVRYGSSTKKCEEYQITESVCFAPLFNDACKSKYYRIIILKGDKDLNRYYSNYCFFSKKQIKNHLKQIPKFCEMKFSVKDTVYKKADAYQLDLYISSDNRTVHKYILTWIRSLFEWPFYLYLLHAKKLKELPQFKFDSVINLFNLVADVHRKSYSARGHTFGTQLMPSTKAEIIKNVENTRLVNNVFPTTNLDFPQCKLVDDFDEITDQLFEKNLPNYLKAYDLVKKEINK